MNASRAAPGPITVVFTPGDLPLFRDGMAGLHPLPPSFLQRPCWVHRAGLHADSAIFTTLPEGPVDPAVHPHFWGMLTDVVAVMTDDAPLRRRILDAEGHGRVTLGYHATGDVASVRAYFAARGTVVDAQELAEAPDDKRPIAEQDTLRAVDTMLPLDRKMSAPRRALRDYLHGIGKAPTPLPSRALPRFECLFQGITPRRFNAVHFRALDVLAATPRRLTALEWNVCFHSPAHDLHALWRAMLGARGIDDDALLPAALAAWSASEQVNSRAWWALDRVARDPDKVLRRIASLSMRPSIHRRLLFASAVTWKLPRFHLLADTLMTRYGHRLDARTIDHLLHEEAARSMRLHLVAHRAGILKGRREHERKLLQAAYDAVYEAEGDPLG